MHACNKVSASLLIGVYFNFYFFSIKREVFTQEQLFYFGIFKGELPNASNNLHTSM